MECTIIKFNDGHRELYYGAQELTWVDARIYNLSESQVDDIRDCATNQVQAILSHIELNFVPIKTINIWEKTNYQMK